MTAAPTPCARTRARTSRYLDGVLRAESRAHVQDHLRRCPECLAVFRQTLELARHAREMPRRAAPSSLAERVRAELAGRRAAQARALAERFDEHFATPRRRWRAAAAVAVLLLVAAAAFALGRMTAPAPAAGDPPRPEPTTVGPAVEPAVEAAADPAHPTRPEAERTAPPRFEPPPIRAETAVDRPGERRR